MANTSPTGSDALDELVDAPLEVDVCCLSGLPKCDRAVDYSGEIVRHLQSRGRRRV